MEILKAPFPWFGGKSAIASLIWERLGPVPNYVEPFAGSLAVLLQRPDNPQIETINDKDAHIANVWRAIQADPDGVALLADWPVNEADLHARHIWLVQNQEILTNKIMGDPNFYDTKMAAWWLWGIACWIGGGWCSGNGPWTAIDGQLVHLGDTGRGVNRQLVHLGNTGRGVNRQLVHLGNTGRGDGGLKHWLGALCDRLRYVRVACGDWTRVMGSAVTTVHGLTGVVLDPPYGHSVRGANLYREESDIVSDVKAWAIANGDNPQLRIVLCGYATDINGMPDSWTCANWKAHGGYGNQGNGRGRRNSTLEQLWFSPHCLSPNHTQLNMFAGAR